MDTVWGQENFMSYVGELGYRIEPTRCDGGNVVGGGRVALIDFKKAKKKFYSTLNVDKETFKAIKLYNQCKNMW